MAVVTRPIPDWKPRNPVKAVTHEPKKSGLLEAWAMLDGPVRLDDLAREAMLSASYTGPADAVRAIANALDAVRPVQVSVGGVVLLECNDDGPAAYRWPNNFTGWAHVKRGAVEDCTALAALAVGVALWGRLPTADEVAAWMDEDEPVVGEEVSDE